MRIPWDDPGRRLERLRGGRHPLDLGLRDPPRGVPRLVPSGRRPRFDNAPALVRWNSDKRYLADLAAAGLPVVETDLVEPGEPLPELDGEVVVKPSVSAGGRDTGRFGPAAHDLARELIEQIQASGRAAMVQPFRAGRRHGRRDAVALHRRRAQPRAAKAGRAARRRGRAGPRRRDRRRRGHVRPGAGAGRRGRGRRAGARARGSSPRSRGASATCRSTPAST